MWSIWLGLNAFLCRGKVLLRNWCLLLSRIVPEEHPEQDGIFSDDRWVLPSACVVDFTKVSTQFCDVAKVLRTEFVFLLSSLFFSTILAHYGSLALAPLLPKRCPE